MRGMHPETQPAAPSLPDYRTHPRAFLKALFDAAVHSAQPLHGMRQWLPQPPSRESGGRTLVLGAGKAGGAMAQALEALWPQDAPLSGLVVTRYGHIPPRPAGVPQRIEVDNNEKCSGQEGVALIRSITTSPVVEQPDSENPR